MQLQKAQRKKAKIRLSLQGPSGSGKTFSSLQVAYGLCNDYSRIAIIDTESNSADLYAHIGDYYKIELSVPHTPERYIQAIETCEKAGMEVIIIDSISHEWEYLLNFHSSLQGNSFTNWSKVTPRHNAFVNKLLSSKCHIICTVRTKTDYVLNEKNGKMVPEKIGLKSVQRDGLEYEFTLVFDLDIKNNATASKDRTGLFYGKPEKKLTVQTGSQLAEWCNAGTHITAEEVTSRINECKSLHDLLSVYKSYPQYHTLLQSGFEQKKRELILRPPDLKTEILKMPVSSNGIHK